MQGGVSERDKKFRRCDSAEEPSGLDGIASQQAELDEATIIAERAGQEIAARFPNLALHQRRRVVTALRRQLFPPGKPGRRRSKEITAAYADWKAGMRGVAFYRKHLFRFDRMGHWQRMVKTRALMDAVRARNRREQRQATSKTCFDESVLSTVSTA
jgi:hypothetical protein